MKSTLQFKDKKVLVLGLAKSGYAVAKLLNSLGADVTVNDSSPEEGNIREAADYVQKIFELFVVVIQQVFWMKDLV